MKRRVPGTYWKLIDNPKASDLRHICDDNVLEISKEMYLGFVACEGRHLEQGLPGDMRLFVEPGTGPIADYPINMLGWPIMSDRMIDCLWNLIQPYVQLIPAPLYEEGADERIDGWQIVNVTKVVDCIDVNKSVLEYYDGEAVGYEDLWIDPSRVERAHIFRYVFPPAGKVARLDVICSFDVPHALDGRGFRGMGFVRCDCTGVDDR